MGYMPIQAHDYEHLYFSEGCKLEIGGADQWGNIVAGVELMRKKHGIAVEAVTNPLLLNSEGQKMGKTSKGAVWVDPNRMNAYDFYQYFVNVADADVGTLLRWFTTLPVREIDKMCKDDIIGAKKQMAYALTEMIHGKAGAEEAKRTSEELFAKGGVSENMPEVSYSATKLAQGVNICELLEQTKICSTRSEARRLIEQGGIVVNENKISDVKLIIKTTEPIIVRRGKKIIIRVKPE